MIASSIFRITNANQGSIEERHDGRQYLLARQAWQRQHTVNAIADFGKGFPEICHAVKFRLIPDPPPERMIAVLLAASRIPSRSLYVSLGKWTYPNVAPGRRNGQALDAP